MRKILRGIIMITIVIGIVILGLKNIFIKTVLERELTKSLGTNVRIKEVNYSIFEEKINMKGIGVESFENDTYDVVRIEEINTKLNYKELFNKKITLEKVDIKNVKIDVQTDRKSKSSSILNIRQEIVSSDSKYFSGEEVENMAKFVRKSYEYLIKNSEKNTIKFKQFRNFFLMTTSPLLNEYIDYEIERKAEQYIYQIIKKYRAISNNIRVALKEKERRNTDWNIEIASLNISLELLGKRFKGEISEISTEKQKINKNINFIFKSEDFDGEIKGKINLYELQGEIKSKISNLDSKEIEEISKYGDAILFLEQNIVLTADTIKITGDLNIKNIELNKKNISEKLLRDKEAIGNILLKDSNKVGDMRIKYEYNPIDRKVKIRSNVGQKIANYLIAK